MVYGSSFFLIRMERRNQWLLQGYQKVIKPRQINSMGPVIFEYLLADAIAHHSGRHPFVRRASGRAGSRWSIVLMMSGDKPRSMDARKPAHTL